MPRDPRALKRLGGGRWQTPDERFTIESEGGRWVVVHAEQTDELGLARVHGPYGTLGDARDAIEGLRAAPVEESPLAALLAAAKERPARPDVPAGRLGRTTPRRRGTATGPPRDADLVEPAVAPEPSWLDGLGPARRRAAEALIDRLIASGRDDAESLVRADLEGDAPIVAATLLRDRLRAVLVAHEAPESIADRILETVIDGVPADGLPGWRLDEVQADGRAGRTVARAAVEREHD